MRNCLVHLRGKHKTYLRRRAKKTKDADYRIRCRIVLKLAEGKSTGTVARQLMTARATASRVGMRFREEGFAGLIDHRMYNGQSKVTPKVMEALEDLLYTSPQDYGWARPTWTRELFACQLKKATGIEISAGHVGKLLHQLGARWKRARPVVICPWPRRKRLLYLASIRRMVRNLGKDEKAFYVDEMDVHLNPRIGPDWMPSRWQNRILTPGKNKKAYVIGALDAKTGDLKWQMSERKNSDMFIEFVQWMSKRYKNLRRIHFILDNYIIHKSKKTKRALEELGDHIVLHFLPPYSSDENSIERVWGEVHANVTRNHKCMTIDRLLYEVDDCLKALSPFPNSKASLRAA